ncbi:MAG: response regulator [Prevotella sp.]|nr:response regulator [Prevotella sp.]
MTNKTKIITLLMLVLTFSGCRKTEPPQQLDKDETQGFVVAQELSNSRVQCIAEDASGQLWIGTFRGLNRYDGHEYHQYFCADDTMGLPDNQIKDILCDRRGRLWVATVNGVCRYTRKDCFERIDVKTSNLNTQKLIEDSKGRIYVYNGTEVLVDDDTEIINYMRLLFAKDYRLITCLDADTALDEMRAEEPNLVLSDVAMPGKDGYELCQEIKQDIQLSHIPVILVTAKITAENQVEGLSVGADAYVTKPFDPAVLSALIQSQLKNRERVRKLLTNATTTEEEGVDNALSGQDKHFMEELYKLMEEELSNSELDVTRITKLLLISRTKLYYKIKGLTGETPSNFFRTYKLNHAAELLKSGKYTVSEIADKCGFSTQSHFSVVFKKQFGVTPTEYKG